MKKKLEKLEKEAELRAEQRSIVLPCTFWRLEVTARTC
jgi:hypothetical protein